MDSLNHTETIRVNFFDADPLGIVWHGNYLKYFEIAREAFGKKYGLTYLDIRDHGFAVPIVETSTKHKASLKYGDTAKVLIEYINKEAANLVFNYTITNEKNQMVCEGTTVQVFTDIKSGELQLINPPFFNAWKQQNKL